MHRQDVVALHQVAGRGRLNGSGRVFVPKEDRYLLGVRSNSRLARAYSRKGNLLQRLDKAVLEALVRGKQQSLPQHTADLRNVKLALAVVDLADDERLLPGVVVAFYFEYSTYFGRST